MKKLFVIYVLSLLTLFTLFYWDASPIANILNQYQVKLSSLLTSFALDDDAMKSNRIFISSTLTLVINKECNGFIPYFFFLASIIAFPSSIKHKIQWAILGYIVLSLLNVFRIWLITQFVMSSENNFSLVHDYLGNLLLVLSALLLFIFFIKTR